MKITQIAIMIMALLMLASVSAISAKVYQDDGELIIVYHNKDSTKSRTMHSYVYIPQTGYYDVTPDFRIKGGSSGKVRVYGTIEDKGYYPVIVALQNDRGTRVKTHTWFIN